MSITLITPTGGRPEAFALCQRYVNRQSYAGPVQWVVVDDFEIPTVVEPMREQFSVEVLRPTPFWTPDGKSTQWRNMIAALEVSRGDYTFVIEDDDWYHPEYIERMVGYLKNSQLVGMQPARYYNVAFDHFREFAPDIDRTSLCQTAWERSLNRHVIDICREETWIDGTLWKGVHRNPWIHKPGFVREYKVVGIKGMPGRKGFSEAHRDVNRVGWENDPDRSRLRQWLGNADAALYDGFGIPRVQEPARMHKEVHLKVFSGIGGQKRYACPHCEYDHYNQAEVLVHLAEMHEKELGLSVPVLFDDKNKKIERTISAKFNV